MFPSEPSETSANGNILQVGTAEPPSRSEQRLALVHCSTLRVRLQVLGHPRPHFLLGLGFQDGVGRRLVVPLHSDALSNLCARGWLQELDLAVLVVRSAQNHARRLYSTHLGGFQIAEDGAHAALHLLQRDVVRQAAHDRSRPLFVSDVNLLDVQRVGVRVLLCRDDLADADVETHDVLELVAIRGSCRFRLRSLRGLGLGLLGPVVSQSDNTVENQRVGLGVLGVLAEVAHALELDVRGVEHLEHRRLHRALHDLERVLVEIPKKVSVLVSAAWVLGREEAVVDAHFARHRRLRRHPLDDPLDLVHALRSVPRARVRVVRRLDLNNLAVGVLDHLLARDDVCELEPHRAAWRQPEEALGRILAEVVGVDVDGAREGNLALAHVLLRMHVRLEHLDLAFRPVGDGDLDGLQHREGARRRVLQRRARAIFQDGHVDVVVRLADADALAEEPQRLWRVAPAPDA
mmetsp:Transcript_10181/g.23837  ORF Transcript_10181/g.23837 Transcript_10181/m.23837 type:complete len:462 (-) Transcript_10181:1316-2701(-)